MAKSENQKLKLLYISKILFIIILSYFKKITFIIEFIRKSIKQGINNIRQLFKLKNIIFE